MDTNFINFSIKNKIDLVRGMMDCLYAQCVRRHRLRHGRARLGQKYRVALRVAKDPRFVRLPCAPRDVRGCCITEGSGSTSATSATCDTDLKRRIRKIPGVPIMYLQQHRYTVERMPEAVVGGAPNR